MVMEALLKKGESLFQEGNLQEAERCFRAFLRENTGHPDCLNNLGVIAHALKDIPTAEALFRRALQSEPQQLDALLNLSDLLGATGRRREALSLLSYIPN